MSQSDEREQLETATKRVKTRHRKKHTHPTNKSRQTKIRQKGMSTENNIGVQTRAMAQRVDNEANREQVQKAMDQATTPTVELHKTKEDTIKEFVQQHGTINLDWYVPDLCNTRVGDLIEKRLQLGTTEGRILFSSLTLNEFFKTSNFELNLQTGGGAHIPQPPGEHRYYMPEGAIRHSPSGTHYKAKATPAQCKRRDSKESQA